MWRDFEAAAPVIARAGRALLEDAPGVPGVAFLATVGAGSRPRMHPFIPAIVDGRLWAFVIVSPKQRDLERDGWYAIHSRLGASDESFFVAGGACRIDDIPLRSLVGESMPYGGIDDRHVLYEFGIDRAMWTTWTTPTMPDHHHWRIADSDFAAGGEAGLV
jgi:hypothetical protein